MKGSQLAQAHSTTYHPQTNGLVERQNRTLVSMLRVYCSRFMDDWDRHLPLTFFFPEYGGKRTAPQTYVRGVMSLEDSRTSMTNAGGTRNRRKLDKKGGLIKGLPMQKPTQLAITSGYSRK